MAKKQFKSESKRLLDLMINSIYTHKEIFLREIISNASDAIDKLCFISLTDDKVGMDRSDFKITINADKENRTLTITDNGIGMDKDDLENNLGTIASSGSYKFKQDMEEKQEEPENLTVVIVKKGDSLAGLVVDNLIGQQEIVIKPLGKYITNNKIISGATILGDGEVALILDVNTLM